MQNPPIRCAVTPNRSYPVGEYASDLKKRFKELGLSGYSGLTKTKLIAKLRDH